MQYQRDIGAIVVWLQHENDLLPWALELRERVVSGAVADDYDVVVLARAIEECRSIAHLAGGNREYEHICGRLFHLYSEIAAKLLENEEASMANYRH